MLPALAELQPVAQWAVLRPGSPEVCPYRAGQCYDGLCLNTGIIAWSVGGAGVMSSVVGP